MAIAKVILNGETLMDVTSNTNATGNMLNGVVGTKNDGTSVTGNIATKTSSNLTVSGATVTAPAGYYAAAASKAVTTTTHPNPTATIASSTGVVTASHTQTTGYVTSGTTTGTLNLTTQAGKTVTPTESAQTAVASYRWTTGPVSVAAISSTYVGTGIARKSAADLTASGSTVTAPVGYYATAASKSVAAGSAFPPAVTITKNPTIGVNTSGVVTASYNGSSSITPTVNAGYISQGTAGTISTTGTSTYQLTSKAAATYYPSTADQTIASQRWLVGNQTIKSVTTSNLTASNIAQGVVVKVGDSSNASRITQVTGTFVGGEDIPVFTAVYNNHNLTSLTCNKTYSECLALINNNDLTGKLILNANDYVNESGMTGVFDSNNNVLKYTGIFEGIPYAEIFYYSNGTLSYLEEPETMQSLSVTSNGTYYGGLGQGKVYRYVDVNVPNTYTATITSTGAISVAYVTYNGTNYYTQGNTFTFSEGDTLYIHCSGGYSSTIYIDGAVVSTSDAVYEYTLPAGNINISLFASFNASIRVFSQLIPTGTYDISSNGTYNVYGYSQASVNILNTYTVDQIATHQISGLLSGSVATDISLYAFAAWSSITSASFPLVSIINSYAFVSCYSLTSVSFPACTFIGGYAFQSCTRLTSVSFPSCSIIGVSAFQSCYSLTTAIFPSCTSISANAFYNCSSLTTISFPACNTISTSVFVNCSALVSVNFPNCINVYGNAFVNCTGLISVDFSRCANIAASAFDNCNSLTTAKFVKCGTIGSRAFRSCYNLISLNLTEVTSVTTLYNINAFASTPLYNYSTVAGQWGSIYVPASLYNSFITATYWETISSRIVSV